MQYLPLGALLLDLLFPDPRRLPHPVQAIAALAQTLEAPARRLPGRTFGGALALVVLLGAVSVTVLLLLSLPSPLGTVAALYLSWSGLALGGLLREGRAALAAIEAAESGPGHQNSETGSIALDTARHAVQMLVSRDTANMHCNDLYRSLAESISENFNDAFVAPFFWLCLGGPLGLWIYKTASTMDSMWGYKTEPWRDLGWASARLDDLLAFIPARLSVILLLAAARLERIRARSGRNGKSPADADRMPDLGWSFRLMSLQAGQCDSPNAGWPMAAAAWLFRGRSGGPTPYGGRVVDKPVLGPDEGKWGRENVAALIRLIRLAGITAGGLTALLLYLAFLFV